MEQHRSQDGQGRRMDATYHPWPTTVVPLDGDRRGRVQLRGTALGQIDDQAEAPTHIILQEQTDRPRVEYEDFRESVGKWVDFIRNNCPNPHAVIILPVNWVLTSCLDTYSETVNLVIDNYRKVAQEFGVVLAPVSSAYRMCYEREGVAALKKWYTDDRHPTIDAAYLAACIEYATIYGEDPTTISWARARFPRKRHCAFANMPKRR